jgi:hypothetical protein
MQLQSKQTAAGAIGAGGVEFLPFFSYGGQVGWPPEQQWAKYDFGTPVFQDLFRAALEAHQQAGLIMDFSLGPNQGQCVPAEATDEGLQWDLVWTSPCLCLSLLTGFPGPLLDCSVSYRLL